MAEAIVNMSKQQKRRTETPLGSLLAKIRNKNEQTEWIEKGLAMLLLLLLHVRSLVCEGRLSWCPSRLKVSLIEPKSPISSSLTTGFSNYWVPPSSDPLPTPKNLKCFYWFIIAEYYWITLLLYYWIKKVLFSRIILQANAGFNPGILSGTVFTE